MATARTGLGQSGHKPTNGHVFFYAHDTVRRVDEEKGASEASTIAIYIDVPWGQAKKASAKLERSETRYGQLRDRYVLLS